MQIEKQISFSCGGALDFVGTLRSVSTLIFNFPRRCRKWASLLAERGEMCQHYFSILGLLLATNRRRSTPMFAAAATKAAENLDSARVATNRHVAKSKELASCLASS